MTRPSSSQPTGCRERTVPPEHLQGRRGTLSTLVERKDLRDVAIEADHLAADRSAVRQPQVADVADGRGEAAVIELAA